MKFDTPGRDSKKGERAEVNQPTTSSGNRGKKIPRAESKGRLANFLSITKRPMGTILDAAMQASWSGQLALAEPRKRVAGRKGSVLQKKGEIGAQTSSAQG